MAGVAQCSWSCGGGGEGQCCWPGGARAGEGCSLQRCGAFVPAKCLNAHYSSTTSRQLIKSTTDTVTQLKELTNFISGLIPFISY